MQVSCSQCSYTSTIDAALLPVGGMQGICPRCRSTIPLGDWTTPATNPPAEAAAASQPETTVDAAAPELPPEGRVSVINILALLFIIDSILSLIGRVPGLSGLFAEGTGISFHQRAKYLYDTLMAAGFFVAAFGLMFRKSWARLLSLWLLGLGLAEGLYLWVYQYFAIVELEKNMNDSFPELCGGQTTRLVGCLFYAFFIVKLCGQTVKARFR